jgi:hypothetical protein
MKAFSIVGPALLLSSGGVALLIQAHYLNPIHMVEWYVRWWPLLLTFAGLMALMEWWLDRNRRSPCFCSNGIKLAFVICCSALLVARHGSFGIYVNGHMVTGEDIARLLTQRVGSARMMCSRTRVCAPIPSAASQGSAPWRAAELLI